MQPSCRLLLILSLVTQLISCANRMFDKEEVCSPGSLAYLKATSNRDKGPQMPQALERQVLESKMEMQKCYDEFVSRTGIAEFQTCLVVGVDVTGTMDYFHLSSLDIQSDPVFIQCAEKVANRIPWWKYGSNYTVLQTYNFQEN